MATIRRELLDLNFKNKIGSTREEFLRLFINLIDHYDIYKFEKDTFEIDEWSTWDGLNIVDVEMEEFDKIVDIIEKIVGGDISKFNQYLYIADYFKRILSNFKNVHNHRRGWRYRYPELYDGIYLLEEIMMYILEQLLKLMKMSPFKLFEMMTSCEKISLRNICLENEYPYDIERYISGFIGY